jgi:hypothetical protein
LCISSAYLGECYGSTLEQDDQIKDNEMGRSCNTHGRDEKYIHNFVRNPEEESPLGRPLRKYGNNIKVNGTLLKI